LFILFSILCPLPSPVLASLELPSPALRERGSERSDAGEGQHLFFEIFIDHISACADQGKGQKDIHH